MSALNPTERNLLYLFEKPYDPLDRPRGVDKVGYDLSTTLVISSPSGPGVETRVNVPNRTDAAPANLGAALTVPKGEPFSFFLRPHRRAAKDLCDVFMKTNGVEDLMQVAASVHDTVNEGLFVYALAFTIIRKPELRQIRLPALIESFPGWFIPQEELTQAQVQANRENPDQPETIIIEHGPDFSSTTIKAEHRVSYWREDYGMNSHHWHWHLVYPLGMGVNRDRKGELFFYMHAQMLARYDMERLSVDLRRVQKLENWRQPIPDGYFPKLTVNNSGRAWGSRQDNTPLMDFRRDNSGLDFVDITDLEIWRSRLLDGIHQGFMVDREGKPVQLRDDVASGKRGIDILGDTLEADPELSVNFPYYGDLHNMGHVLLAFSHDPDYAHKEEMGVMGDTATAMRDPVFYRWHKFVDDMFQEYKLTQPPYTLEDLQLPDVKVERVGVVWGDQSNSLVTGWSVKEFEASRGLDFNAGNPVLLRLTHLDHQPFNYHIMVTNEKQEPTQVTIRIFLAPRENERGETMGFMDQRLLWAEMDKFTVQLKSGSNHIVRASKDSSVTNPNEFTFRDLEQRGRGESGSPNEAEFDFCGCGWPEHLLLPRGKPGGMAFQLFVMITDFEKDKVPQTPSSRRCGNGVSFCGILDAQYPDSRPMGFPFDRRPAPVLGEQRITSAADLATLDNIFLQDITITFTNSNLEK